MRQGSDATITPAAIPAPAFAHASLRHERQVELHEVERANVPF